MAFQEQLTLGYNTKHPFSLISLTDRKSVQDLLKSLLGPLRPHFSPQKALIRVPGSTAVRFDARAAEIEGFCRPLWGLSSLLAGGGDYEGTEWWVEGLKKGTDPTSEEYWGEPRDNDQRMVEMCPLGFTLAVAPVFWEKLTEKERGNVETWLGNSINSKNMPNTNWLWFRVFANLGLKKNGGKFSQERIEQDIVHLNSFFRGEGWSNDGPEGIWQQDYYSGSFAIQFLQLIYSKWWQTQDQIWSPTGTLTVGYSFPNMFMSENYNSPGSPYWACLAFICLAVPESHPFWKAEEEPYPINLIPEIKALKHPGHIVSYLGGHKIILSSGQACSYPMRGTHAKYGSFAYSSAYAYSVPTGCFSLEQFALASQLGLSDDGGEVWKTRRLCETAVIETHDEQPVLKSIWHPFPDVTIKTYLIPPVNSTPNWHIRTLPKIIGNYDLNTPEGSSPGSIGAFAVSKGAVGIAALESDGKSLRTAMLVNADPNSNLVESRTVIPTLQITLGSGTVAWFVTGIYAKPSGEAKNYLDGWKNRPAVPGWLINEIRDE
ncbi:hypothetical protein DID88_010192 [Monilinia fructigena]|uniref:Uncharacterized protein n=1 Tax=Monilinia fructigena TaxID=38457 RepID=A0A395IMS9_9HELO|nr:hypothetical protein DID88_010192 [Monilinia fructigena]